MAEAFQRSHRIDVVAAWVVCIVSLAVTTVTALIRPRYSEVAVFGIVAGAVYLLFGKAEEYSSNLVSGRRFMAGSSTGFMLTLALSAFTLRSASDPYQRSLWHFVAISALFAILGLQVVGYKGGRARMAILVEICLVTWWVRAAPQLLFPGALGIDSWFHLGVVKAILETGTIPHDNIYRGLALFHTLSAAVIETTALPGATSVNGLGPFLGALAGVGVFLGGRRIFDERIALLAALAYGFSGYMVNMNLTFVAANLGAAFLALVLATLIRYWRSRRVAHVVPSIVMMIALIGTHTIMALTLFIVLTIAFVVSRLGSRLMAQGTGYLGGVRGSLTLFFGVTMFAWWAYFSGYLVDLSQLISWGFRFEPWTPTDTSLSYASSIPTVEYLLNLAGLVSVVFLGLLGSLWFLRKRPRSPGARSTLFGIWALGALGISSIGLQVTGLLGLRWILEFEVLAGLLVGPGILWIATRFQHRLTTLVAVGLVIGAVAFANLTSPTGNVDTSVYSPSTLVRLAFTPGELESLSQISALRPTSVYVLYPDYYYFLYYQGTSASDVGPILANHAFSTAGRGLIVLRVASLEGPVYYTQTLAKLNYSPISVLLASDNKVYDSGAVVAFSSP